MTCIGLIPARGGSKGIPRKNLAPLAGKPLIAWTIEAARESAALDRVIVSTDDSEIAEVSRRCGAEVPFLRPPELARDDSPTIDTVEHALRCLGEQAQPDAVMVLQPTSPLRTAADIDAAVELFRSRGAPAVVSVCEASPHPSLARTIGADGTLDYLFPDTATLTSRHQYPRAFMINGAIYLARCDVLLATRKFQPPGTLAFLMPAERSIDIDTPCEFRIADLLLRDSRA